MVRNAVRSLLRVSWTVAAAATTLVACRPILAQNTFLPGQISGQSAQSDVVPFEIQNGLIVVKALVGDGLVGSAIVDIPAGQPVLTKPNVLHWHGAAPDQAALQFSVYSGTLEWKDAVSDEQYLGKK